MKKLNKFFAVLVALAMMATLCVSMAFAANTANPNEGETATPEKSYLVKYLELADSVSNPNVYFKFNFTATENTANLDVKDMPAIPAVFINPQRETDANNDANSVYGAKAFKDILPTYKTAGVYTYTVAEDTTQVYSDDQGNVESDLGEYAIKYAEQTYIIRVYVKADGTVSDVTATKAGENTKEKITTEDPATDKADGGVTISGLTFDNKVTKSEKIDPDDVNPENDLYGVLNLRKKVATTSKDAFPTDHANDKFTFNLTLNRAYGDTTALPQAYVVKANASIGTKTAYDGTLDYGTNKVTLGIDEVLFFETLPAGVTWQVEEDLTTTPVAHAQYQAAYEVTSKSLATKATDSAKAGDNLKTDIYTLKQDTDGEKAVYTNTYDDKLDKPEGIMISNLPYIVLALVAVGGLVAYVVVRRKADEA